MVHKAVAQRDVEYLNELLSKETDANRRTILLRLLTDAKEKLRQAEEQEKKGLSKETLAARDNGIHRYIGDALDFC